MSYDFQSFDGTRVFHVTDAQVDRTQAPVAVVGRNVLSYGVEIMKNLEFLLENFAANDVTYLNTLKPVTGQCWYDKTTTRLRVNSGTPSAPTWELVGKPIVADAAPANAMTGDLWYDSANKLLKVFDGTVGYANVSTATVGGALGSGGTFTSVAVNDRGQVTSGGNLTLTGDATGTAAADHLAVTLANSGVTAGTYCGITVDAKGRVTTATNSPTVGNLTVTGTATMATASVTTNLTAGSATIGGNAIGSNARGTRTILTTTPTGGVDGDIWYQY